jgi:aryl-alcohol dehydrogenase-like predicted oxidoreductase
MEAMAGRVSPELGGKLLLQTSSTGGQRRELRIHSAKGTSWVCGARDGGHLSHRGSDDHYAWDRGPVIAVAPICLQNQAIFRENPTIALGGHHVICEPPPNTQESMMSGSISRRVLGRQGLTVSALGLGCMGMSDFYGPSDHAANLAVLNHAIDIGVNFLDTADMYGNGRNEQLLSEVLRTRRSEVVLATKFGNVLGSDGKWAGVNGTPEYVAAACDASLKRLGVDHIDLYYQHRVDPRVPIEDTVGAMARLVQSGKVRHLGLSEASSNTLWRAAHVHPIAALQSEYSLWTRDVESEVLPACRDLGIGFVAYSPLGRGFLTGKIQSIQDLSADDWRRTNPRFQDANAETNKRLVQAVTAIAAERGCTPAQLAVAWLLHQGRDVVPIPGTRSISRLDENAAATGLALAADELHRIGRLLASSAVAGTRYLPAGMDLVKGESAAHKPA